MAAGHDSPCTSGTRTGGGPSLHLMVTVAPGKIASPCEGFCSNTVPTGAVWLKPCSPR